MRVTFQWAYSSGYTDGVRYAAGAVADLPDDVAEAINRDSPGVLVPVAQVRQVEAARDRMIKAASNRALVSQDERGAVTYSDEADDWVPGGDDIDALPLPPGVLATLTDAGYSTVGQVRDASDEDLRALDGIGPAMLRRIREAVG